MTDRTSYTKFCIGAYGKPCPTDAIVPTRYAVRCKSCAARERLRTVDNTEQLEAARANSPTVRKHYAEIAYWRAELGMD